MRPRLLLWIRHVAAVLIFLVAVGVAVAAGLLTPYFLAAPDGKHSAAHNQRRRRPSHY